MKEKIDASIAQAMRNSMIRSAILSMKLVQTSLIFAESVLHKEMTYIILHIHIAYL